jgi:hypothetical protein
MNELPQIVYERLRSRMLAHPLDGGVGDRAHPDADLLTAFAEQALSAKERESVLEHLALCGNCREALALANPAATETEAVRAVATPAKLIQEKDARNWRPAFRFGWPNLRWAALAAGIVVAAAVLLLHPGKLNQGAQTSAKQQVTSPVPAVPVAQLASPSLEQSPASAQYDETRSKQEYRFSKKLDAGPAVARARKADSELLLAENKEAKDKTDKLSAGAAAFDAPSSRGATETVEVSAVAPAPVTVPSSESRLMARSEKQETETAKATPQTDASQLGNTLPPAIAQLPVYNRNVVSMAKVESHASRKPAQPVTWAITTGVLQRSLDSGRSWQKALRADHLLLCYASHDEDVWAGGQAGTLFHSADRGLTWAQVQPSIHGQRLSFDITHVDVTQMNANAPAKIVISTSNNEIWSSTDGGKTWDKE